jgi:diacylglycerol kinase (ATP)
VGSTAITSDSAVLLVNAGSRNGDTWFQAAKACLSDELKLIDSRVDRDPKAIDRSCQQAVLQRVPLVIVGGGDGTLSLVARHFVGSDTVLGVLPLGTGNAFARDLAIPPTVEAACDVILNGKTEQVDLGHANNDYFVNVATVGLTTRIVRELTDEAKKRFGRAVYLYAMCRALTQVRPFRAKIVTPEGTLDFETLQVVIGNGRYHAGPFPLSPDASITDSRLAVYGLATTNKAALLRIAMYLPTGRHVELPEVQALSTTGGLLETEPIRNVTVDGQITFRTPLNFSVAPKAVRVRVPDSFRG